MESWDQSKLEKVVASKYKKKAKETKIVCKHFITAIEKKKYGWFWACPIGDKCFYQHKLPPGYVLKSDAPVAKVDDNKLEERIDEQRMKLDHTKGIAVTPETFAKWKKAQRKKKNIKKAKAKKEAVKKNAGRAMMSGRDLFAFNPDVFVDDEDAVDEIDFSDEDVEDNKDNAQDKTIDEVVTQINEDLFLDDEDLPSSDEDED